MKLGKSDEHVKESKKTGLFPLIFIIAAIAILLAILLPAIIQVRNAAKRISSMNNLRQLALAVHNYESAHQKFPLATMKLYGSEVEHGWEITLLPFLEANNLPSRVDYNQAWNSFHNDYVFAQELPMFLSPLEKGKYDKDGFPLAHYAANSEVIFLSAESKNSESTNEQDILFGEICNGYMPWGKPGNARPISNGIKFDATSFGNPHFQGAAFACADGSTKFVESKLSRPETIEQTAFRRRSFEISGSSNLNGFSCYSQYSPLLNGNIIFFGLHTGYHKGCDFPEGIPITDAGLLKLKNLINLKGVDLGVSSEVTEDAIETLSKLTELEYLSLGDVAVAEANLLHLLNLKNLKELALLESESAETAIKLFEQSNPNCKVRFLRFD